MSAEALERLVELAGTAIVIAEADHEVSRTSHQGPQFPIGRMHQAQGKLYAWAVLDALLAEPELLAEELGFDLCENHGHWCFIIGLPGRAYPDHGRHHADEGRHPAGRCGPAIVVSGERIWVGPREEQL